MIMRCLEVGPFLANCYIVGSTTTKEGMVIDPGDEGEAILQNARDMGLNIKLIVVTHAHIDHVGAVEEVKEATGAEFALHRSEAQSLQGQSKQWSTMFDVSYNAPKPDRFLEDGDSINIGDLRFVVLYTPGHSSGGISLLGQGVVFTGDTLFNLGIGRTDFPGASYERIMESIHRKLMVLTDDTKVFPGHGPETTIGAERRGNSFLRG